ncbi:MAG: hypothetical protein ABUJ92_12560, partial [Desulfobacterales bacterium]
LKYVMLTFRRTAQTLDKDPSGKIVRSCLSVTLPVVRREARMPREQYLLQQKSICHGCPAFTLQSQKI